MTGVNFIKQMRKNSLVALIVLIHLITSIQAQNSEKVFFANGFKIGK
tara:strand:- start:5640 stop:5780 length:141 start_codon:yes stop_codon:yes gene_type:complete